jgi:hypothetical protein
MAACRPRATDSLVVRFGLPAAAPDNTILGEPPVAGIAAATARGSSVVGNALKRTGSDGAGSSVALSSGASVGNSCISPATSCPMGGSCRGVSIGSAGASAVAPVAFSSGFLRKTARTGVDGARSNCMAVCTRASCPAETRMPLSRPWPTRPLPASMVYVPASSAVNRYSPFLVVVVRISAPVAWFRRTTVAPASGAECRSVSLPVREPLRADWACMGIPAPKSSTATASGFTHPRFTPAIETPVRGRPWENSQNTLRLPALAASQDLGMTADAP